MAKKNLILKIFLSSISIYLIILYLLSIDSLTQNMFMWFDYYNKPHTPYYDILRGSFILIFFSIFIPLLFNKKYTILWFIKIFVTLVIMIPYEAHYGLDSFMYFGKAVVYNDIPWHNQHGTQFIIFFNQLLTYFVGKSYYALKIVNSFIGFLGLVFLYKSFEYLMRKSKLPIDKNFIYYFFLFPSVIFWSSILGKDPLNLFFIGLFSYSFIQIIDNLKLTYLAMLIIAVISVGYIRPWWSVIMIMTVFFYFVKINSTRNFLFFIMVLPVFMFMAMEFLQTQGITSTTQLFLKMTETSKNLAYGGSSVGYHQITGFGDYLIWYIPNLFTSLFRPMPWDIRNAFTLIAAIENTILLYFFYKYILKNWKAIYQNKYLKFYIILIFSWSLFYVIISPTNLGMAVRFKLQVLPAMLILIGTSYQIYNKRIKNNENSSYNP